MSRLTAATRDYAPAQQSEPRHSDSRVAPESTDAVVVAFPRLMASQADLLAAARDLIQCAYALTRSEAIAQALVEADELLEHLVVD